MAIQKTRDGGEVKVTVSFSDSINLIRKQVRWSPKGVSLLTKWPFQVGAEVEFAFDHKKEKHCCVGVVVACRGLRRPVGFFETVLYFVETPCTELQKAASDCRLAHERQINLVDETHFTTSGPTLEGNSANGVSGVQPRVGATRSRSQAGESD